MNISGSISDILNEKGEGIFSIPPDAKVSEAIKMMADKNVGALLVLSGKKLCGVISERDYTRKVILKGNSSKKASIESIMTRKLSKMKSDATVEEALKLMTGQRIRHLPVYTGRKLVGVISIGDLVKWVISEQSATIEHLENYITGNYPG
ncbi:MAG TPA: CBS domain-containing protein [Verrucomicrobiales bacterium]|nr:CBS domain-containing protein [Verrucomicrobiales bacterium]HIL71181.1 CBS domain-containing protein [Verrucomicrobiota bacterium]